jgi:tetrahydromethanopterin S-methyltransferase subunit A
MEKVTEKQLIELVKLAYGEDMPDTYEQARKHDSGDSLADFIIIELHEGTEGEKDKVAEAIRVMRTAKMEIDAVLMALIDAQAVGIEKAMKAWSGE